MVQIAELPFTQYDNLNILNQLRVNGVLVTPGGGQDIIQVLSGDYDQELDDDVVIITGASTLNLILASTAIKSLTIKSKLPGGDITITPFSGDTINGTTTLVIGAGSSTVIAPVTDDWEIIG